MLELTHTLSVNPPNQPVLSIDSLWSGLLLRILEPMRFTVGLDGADILERSESRYRRALHFGEHVVHDVVNVNHNKSVEFVTDATEKSPSGRLLIEIENRNPDELRLKFFYTTQFPEPSNDEERALLEMIKNAYMAADMDMIRIIREYAEMTKH
ncbi:AtaL-like protein [Hydromonas duriensis]|uniref:Uncharacterized protein DUF1857 n=1 Tax=Hydromonas duriensis TaxID=1527608 RepID=A0A4R6Y786_9BURK|nr:AtaL-like protein [Hydromonas duriensis]TDR31173.1 uncharacterized protein DUF1857 [Hydromonas duriensis]